MVFGNISTLYLPTTANAGASQWGTDVRKLLDSADAGSDALTKTNHGTGAAVVRTKDPYTTTAADLDQTLYGWAVTPTDMGSTSTAKRFLPAGNHVATIRVGHTAATAKNANYAMYVYRVGNAAGGRVRTQLGTANSGTVSIPGLAGELTVTITVALGEIILEDDETLQYSFEVGAAGTAVSGDILTMFTGTQSAVVGRIDIPKLGVLKDFTGTADGSSTATAAVTPVLGTVGTGDGVGTGAGVLSALASMTGTASGTDVVLGAMSSLSGMVGTAVGTSTADGEMALILGTVGTATVGGDCPADWPVNDGLKAIAGTVLFHEPPNQGDPVDGATVKLVRDSDGLLVASTVTDALGAYSFPRDTNDPYTYHVEVTWTDGGTPQQGMSEGGCVPV